MIPGQPVSRETGSEGAADRTPDAAVSRETDPGAPPAFLAERYPAALAKLVEYAARLATDGVVRGLIGPREVPRLWDRHLANCAVVEELLVDGSTVADVGSGAGLPGLVLAILRPNVEVHLIEASLRRSTFLQETVDALGLTNVTVVRSRAEELPKSARFDVVTSRAVAPLPRLAAWCAPLLSSEGRILALKGEQAEAELAEASDALSRAGLRNATVHRLGGTMLSTPTTVIELIGPVRAPVRARQAGQGGQTAQAGPTGQSSRTTRNARSGQRSRRGAR